ncbi:MAG TPA: DNA topoisomerase IB [Blastocatellia bacterium]|nr:DNA topoisomerase IB [Blastocatellia bacterium]
MIAITEQNKTPPIAEPTVQAAIKSARLRYVNDNAPGIKRMRAGKGFRYVDSDGKPVRDAETLRRIKSLAIPPAWTEVWICPFANGHIQATGRDVKGRKQYRYHPRWCAERDATKYDRMIAFGSALPKLRRRVEQDLARPGLPREKVLATLVQLLETTLIRVGNEEYARTNGSFGLTTLRNQHAKVEGATLRFQFRGKSGVYHTISLKDRRLAGVVKRCQDLPGQELFQYLDEAGICQTIDSSDVNAYLQEITGEAFTAKDFRTWAGTVLATAALKACGACTTQTETKQNIVRAIENVAARLGNTPAVCRKSYVHPLILELYGAGTLPEILAQVKVRTRSARVRPEEAVVLALLQQTKAAPCGNDLTVRKRAAKAGS